MKYFKQSLLMVTLISLAGLVSAQSPGYAGRGPIPFSALDLNADGSISQQEFEATHSQRRMEPRATGKSPRRTFDPPRFSDFDLNNDGSLSQEELIQGQNSRRAQRQQEMNNAGRGSDWNRGPGRGMAPGSTPGMPRGRGRNMPAFSDFDLDGDGSLHLQEFEQARAQRIRDRLQQGYRMRNLQNAPSFADIDTDGNGLVTLPEFTAAQARHRQP